MRVSLRWVAVAAMAAAVVGCAKPARPPGGPVDRTAPTVIGHQPAADATGVDTDQAIVIEFSEPMDRTRTSEAVFLAPQSHFDLDWSGRRLRVAVEGGLAMGRTYVVTVGTDARDLRSNRLEQSFQLSFATGDRLDDGKLTGRVVSAEHEPIRGAFVWAYDMELFDGRTARDPPAYVTQSGADGGFRFERLSSSRYRTIAFRDGNRNQEPDAGEPLGFGHADIEASSEGAADGGVLVLAAEEEAVGLEGISAVDRQRVLLTFDAPVDPERIDLDLGGLAVDRLYGAPTDPTKVYALTATQTPGATYTATVVYAGVSVPNPDEPLRGSDRPDRRPPELTDAAPNGVTLQADSLSLSFSEPMDTSRVPQAEDWAPPDSSRSWTGHWRWAGPLRLVYDLSTSPPPGEHRFDVGLGRMQDLAGNAATDSAGTFDFELLPAAEAGAIAGVALWPSETAPIRLQLVGGTRQLRETVADASGAFEFAPIVPGDYVLVAFVDRDGNGVHDRGRLDPFVPAEPMALVDTLSVERGQRQTVHLPVEPPE